MTGALCITVSAPIADEHDELCGVFGVDIRFEEWTKSVDLISEATERALKSEYEAKKKSDHWF
jgi:hypothetical protein